MPQKCEDCVKARLALVGVEVIIGLVTAAGLGSFTCWVATFFRCLSGIRVKALDAGDGTHHAGTSVVDGREKEPGNGVGVGGWHASGHFAFHLATVARFPCGAGEMLAHLRAVFADEFGLGSFEGPSALLANVDLIAGGVDLEHEVLVAGRLELLGGVGGLRVGYRKKAEGQERE